QVMRHDKQDKILQMGKRVVRITEGDEDERIDKTIEFVETFFRSLGVKTHLKEYGVNASVIDKIVNRFEERKWNLGENKNITPDMVRQILLLAL
ncbi:MAG: iron-containing alcohol dehydrogenase, partial [Bacteroidales bacterium]